MLLGSDTVKQNKTNKRKKIYIKKKKGCDEGPEHNYNNLKNTKPRTDVGILVRYQKKYELLVKSPHPSGPKFPPSHKIFLIKLSTCQDRRQRPDPKNIKFWEGKFFANGGDGTFIQKC